MQNQLKMLCEAGRFSEAIEIAQGLPNDQMANLIAIKGFLLRVQKRSKSRDLVLRQLIFAFKKVGGMEKGLTMILAILEEFDDKIGKSYQQLFKGISQVGEKIQESISSQ